MLKRPRKEPMLKPVEKINYRIVKELGVLSKKDNTTTELNLISYNDYRPKLDLRKWETKEDGTKFLKRGLTLTDAEAKELIKALENYLASIEASKEVIEA